MRIRNTLLAAALPWAVAMLVAQAQPSVVKMLFFYSPSCSKCEGMITEYWPAAFAKYGDQLQVMFIDISRPANLAMWQAAENASGVPEDEHGVPGVIIGGDLIIGDGHIKQQLYGLIDQYLAKGGVEFPPLHQPTQTPGVTPSATMPGQEAPAHAPSAGTHTVGVFLERWPAMLATASVLAIGLYAWRRRRGVKA